MANITNSKQNALVSGTSSADSISNTGSDATVKAGAGNDIILNKDISHWSALYGEAGNDSIYSSQGNYITINGGTGNDTIHIHGMYSKDDVIQYSPGDGDDLIIDDWYGINSPYWSMQIGDGNDTYSTVKSGSDVIIYVGSGKITVQGAGKLDSINIAGVYKDPDDGMTFDNSDDYALINGTKGDDTINSYGQYSTINGNSGHDYISAGLYNNITGGAGEDSIYLGKGTVSGGTDNDYIELHEGNNLVKYSSGDGYDIVEGFSETDTLQIANGYYSMSSNWNEEDDDEDVIVSVYDANAVDGGKKTGKITLTGAGELVWEGGINIKGSWYSPFTEGDDTYYGKEEFGPNVINAFGGNDVIYIYRGGTIDGGSGNDTISVDDIAYRANINGGSGNDRISNWGWNSTIDGGSGNDYIINYFDYVTISGGTGNDTVELGVDELEGWSSSNALVRYASGDGDDTILGFNAEDTLQITSGSISSSVVSGNDLILTVGSGKITLKDVLDTTLNLKLANGTLTTLKVEDPPSWKLSGTTATYGTSSKTLTTVTGVKSLDGISLNEKIVTVSAASLNNSKVTISGDYTLALASGISAPKNTSAHWTVSKGTAKYYSASNSAGYTLSSDKKSVNYTSAVSEKTLATVTGLKDSATKNDISVSGNVITLKNSALDKKNISGSGNYTLALASDISAPKNTSAHWTVSDGTAKYYSASNSAGYTLSSDKKFVSYTSAISGKTLATVTGLKDSATQNDISVNGNIITLKSSALDKKNISGSGNYTLSLTDDVSAPKTTSAHWTVSDGTAKYYSASTSAGYTLSSDKKSANYTSAISGKTLATVTGLKDSATQNDISVSGNVITLKNSALDKKNISGSGNYTLTLADDVSAPKTTSAGFKVSGTTATYKNKKVSAGYTLSSDKKSASYTKASGGSTLFTVKGLKKNTSAKNLSLKNKVVTLKADALGTSKVTISNGYTLALDKNVSKSSTKKAAWSYKNSVATYKSSYKTAGYTLASNKKSVSYSKATTPTTLATIKGAKSKSGITLSGKKITLKNSALSKKITVSGGYEFDFAKDYGSAKIFGSTKADTITARGKKITVNGGKGNDTIKIFGASQTLTGGAGADIFIYNPGSGDARITDMGTTDTLRIGDGKDTYSTEKSGKNLIVTVGKGKITLTGAANLSEVKIEGTNKSPDDGIIVDGKKVTLTENFMDESFSLTGDYKKMATVDASEVVYEMNITGNSAANLLIGSANNDEINGGGATDTIYGGDGDDILIGGKGNDFLYGGEGDDIFAYKKGDGSDKIFDYTEGDWVSISGDSVKSFSTNGKNEENLILNLASKKKITVMGGAYEVVNYNDDKKDYSHSHFINFKNNGKSATLKESYARDTFDLTNYSKVNNVTSSAVQHGLNIIGNDNKNSVIGTNDDDTIFGGGGADTIKSYAGNDSVSGGTGNDEIHGGEGNDTLWGGKGNDLLYGEEGRDTFLYNKGDGDDTIFDYDSKLDKIIVSCKVTNAAPDGNGNLVFSTEGNGKIILDRYDNTAVTFTDITGKHIYNDGHLD